MNVFEWALKFWMCFIVLQIIALVSTLYDGVLLQKSAMAAIGRLHNALWRVLTNIKELVGAQGRDEWMAIGFRHFRCV